MVVRVAHDFICPWCWIALFQIQELQDVFGIEVEWEGYELFPEGLDWPESKPKSPSASPDRPATPSRLDLAYAAQRMTPPTASLPYRMRSTYAHQAHEYAREVGMGKEMREKLYRSYWEQGREINSIEVLVELAEGVIPDLADYQSALVDRRFADRIVPFDDAAYAKGVYNLPTIFLGDQRFAEQPITVLRDALRHALI